ncbi:hypothetical protein BDV41DRAFT_334657 [Aspergillus transmontanensis]|uniref:Uncharacterized protein n=1 Tax=Aspergillus transmontanensis TaxID=1034304 RepID=A0A5N6VT15_9EURO|nr:hypothetical protein BDV41DRAFT_334657 [Aspergillus transmontanensis]
MVTMMTMLSITTYYMRIRSYGRSTKNFLLAAAGNRPFGIGGTPSSMVSLCVVPKHGTC